MGLHGGKDDVTSQTPIGKAKTHSTGYYSHERDIRKVRKAYRTGGGGSGELASEPSKECEKSGKWWKQVVES